ncbi:MAG: cell division protein ZapA [Hyphomicrobiales bacterium]|nr:cell division protein ZapA [Hyphomicrobiales bacterium]
MGQVNVTISGKTFRMACGDGEEEHLASLGQRLDETIEELRSQFGEIGDQRLTVMAAITMADQYTESERRIGALESEIAGLEEARAALVERQDGGETEIARSLEVLADRLEAVAGRLSGTDPLEHSE